MIFLILTFAYFALISGLVWISKRIGRAQKEKQQKNQRAIIFSSLILYPVLGFLFIIYLFGIGLEDHHDVKRGTVLWFLTMDNETITEFPIIDPVGRATYHSIGGDSPNIGTGWEIQYKSKANEKELTRQILDYLRVDGYEMKEVEKTQYYWIGRYNQSDSQRLFSGHNPKGESLDLILKSYGDGSINIDCTIVY